MKMFTKFEDNMTIPIHYRITKVLLVLCIIMLPNTCDLDLQPWRFINTVAPYNCAFYCWQPIDWLILWVVATMHVPHHVTSL